MTETRVKPLLIARILVRGLALAVFSGVAFMLGWLLGSLI